MLVGLLIALACIMVDVQCRMEIAPCKKVLLSVPNETCVSWRRFQRPRMRKALFMYVSVYTLAVNLILCAYLMRPFVSTVLHVGTE